MHQAAQRGRAAELTGAMLRIASGSNEPARATATNRAVDIRTMDPDLGRTIALWLADVLEEFSSAKPSGKVIVDDDGLAGRPFRQGTFGCGAHDFRARREAHDVVRLVCSSSSIVFPSRPYSAPFRKLLAIVGAIRDAQPLNHLQVVRQQQRIRRSAATALSVTRRAEKCKFLLRVDDFPSPFVVSDEFLRFHEMAAEHGLPYLLGVTPFFGRDEGRNLSEREIHILHRCSSEGTELALHGFSHRSRYRNYASELLSMPVGLLREELDRAEAYLRSKGLTTIGFVAPYNGYDPLTVAVLAERYSLLCGGPESVAALGRRAGPSFLMQSLYVPSYRDVYDIELRQLGRFDRLIAEADGLILPVTLHWANEARGGFRTFRALCARLSGRTLRWSDFLSRAAWVRSLQPSR